jgi:hypothetical protein
MTKISNQYSLTNILTTDLANSRLGINNVSPAYSLDITGTTKVSGILTLGSTISNGTYAYTLPSATGTLALTSDLTGYLPLAGGTLTGALSGTSATFSSSVSATTGTFSGKISANTSNGIFSNFGGTSIGTTNGNYTGISLGYSENTTYTKTAIVQEQINDGAARGHLHFLVDTANDGNNAVLGDSKMMINGTSGNVLIGTTTDAGYKLDVNGQSRVKGKFIVEQASGGGLHKQVLTGQITAAATGVAKKIAYVGFTHSITVHLYAHQAANSGMTAIASFTTVYGNSAGGITQSSATQGNVSGITVSYNNGGSPAYTIDVSVTYANSAPIIYYVIEGINNDNNIYSL